MRTFGRLSEQPLRSDKPSPALPPATIYVHLPPGRGAVISTAADLSFHRVSQPLHCLDDELQDIRGIAPAPSRNASCISASFSQAVSPPHSATSAACRQTEPAWSS